MNRTLSGIHHVTAICGDPQRNVDFYAGVLGLRFVKKTVNFDDPGAYHLYFGDAEGNPGSIVTFFAWPGAPRGRMGAGQITAMALAAPHGSIEFWTRRLAERNVAFEEEDRFGEKLLRFVDPDGMPVEIIASEGVEDRSAWPVADIPDAAAIRSLHGVTTTIATVDASGAMYEHELGFHELGSEGNRHRFETGEGGAGALLDVIDDRSGARPGRIAVGQIHHVAWRTPSDEEEVAWRDQIMESGHSVTPVMDRQYFRSIYFHEPGGVLFEIATDPPGFGRDEPLESLGTRLMLPPWLEPHRGRIEETLPPIHLPSIVRAAR